jgi:hypothetical protein
VQDRPDVNQNKYNTAGAFESFGGIVEYGFLPALT